MNLLSNICNPKDEHFEHQSKTQAYKPLSDYVFENRAMDRMRARYERERSFQQFQYQSWNHPYSISNYLLQQNSQQPNSNPQQQQSGYNRRSENGSYYLGSEGVLRGGENAGKKISFKDVSGQQFCTANRGQQHGERQFRDRDQFYSTMMKQAHPYYNSRTHIHQDQQQHQRDQRSVLLQQERENLNMTASQSYSHSLLGKEIVQLKQENQQLKRVIEDEYKPLKELYNKLLVEQQEREYLISKLEWKVRELVKDYQQGSNNGGVGSSGGYQQPPLLTHENNKSTLQVSPNHAQAQQQPYQVQTLNTPLLNNNNKPSLQQSNLIGRNASSQIVFQQQLSHNLTHLSVYFPQQQLQPNNNITYQQNQNNAHSKQSHRLDNSYHSRHIPVQNHTQKVNFQNSQFIIPNPYPQTNFYQNKAQNLNFEVKRNS